MGFQYFKRGIVTVGAGNRAASSDYLASSGGFAYDTVVAGTTSANLPGYGVITITGAATTSVYTISDPPSDRAREVIITCTNGTTALTALVVCNSTAVHYQSSDAATTTQRQLTFNHAAAFVRLMATSSQVWHVMAGSTAVLQASTG